MELPSTTATERPKTHQFDSDLPNLPVPDLGATFALLRDSCAAIATSEEDLQEFDDAATEAITELQQAQKVLLRRHEELPNYIGPWWEEFAYLRSRYPNVINTNIFAIRDADFDALEQPNPIMVDPVARAALVSWEALWWRRTLIDETLAPDALGRDGQIHLCMNQFRKYYSTRIPRKGCDVMPVHAPESVRRIMVMHRGAIFFVKAVADDGVSELSYSEIRDVIRLGVGKVRPPPLDECVGIMTTANRDDWAAVWEKLCDRSDRNKTTLDKITKVISLVAIDDEPITTLHEGSVRASHGHCHNRWYDRAATAIVASNGVVAQHGEHTTMDAPVSASVPVDLGAAAARRFVAAGGCDKPPRGGFRPEEHLEMVAWDLTEEIKMAIRQAHDNHLEVARHSEVDAYAYRGFGRDALRNAKVPADAFVQQVLQLAYFRDRKRLAPVYESGSTRIFKEGRTDTIRSLTPAQRRFVVAFDDPHVSTEAKVDLFRQAVKKHESISKAVATGRGCDRHLLALKIAQQLEIGRPLPRVFSLKIVTAASSFELLTSQMVSRTFVGGFAHALPDGYGCCYYLRRNAVCIMLSGNNKEGLTSVERFKDALTRTFHDVANLVMQAHEPHGGGGSKL